MPNPDSNVFAQNPLFNKVTSEQDSNASAGKTNLPTSIFNSQTKPLSDVKPSNPFNNQPTPS